MYKDIRVFRRPHQEVAVGCNIEVEVKMPKSVGKVTDFKIIFFEKDKLVPTIEKRMIKIEEDNIYDVYCTESDVQFSEIKEYFFFFVITLNGKEKALKASKDFLKAEIVDPSNYGICWPIKLIPYNIDTPDWAIDKDFYKKSRYDYKENM